MNWKKLLSEKRIRNLLEGEADSNISPDERTNHGRDYDRAIFSTPVRRMQDKTQVFPLDPNDSVRTRLTHSLEVSNLARNLARGIGIWLQSKGEITPEQKESIEVIAATSGLIHDLGNPPFGHSGEKAISEWFKERESERKIYDKFPDIFKKVQRHKRDFLEFNGNAQTIRLISKLQVLADLYGLNFTCATMSAACKYIASSDNINNDIHEKSKLGFFASEKDLIKQIQRETGTENKRNPIAYIVEAADDITYSVVDIEDGVKKGVMSWDILKEKLEEEFIESLKKFPNSKKDLLKICFKKAKSIIEKDDCMGKGRRRDNAMAQSFRVIFIIETAKFIQKAFQEKYEYIMNGNYHNELFKDSKCAALIECCKIVGQKYIYCSEGNLKLELMGRRVIYDLMDIFWEGVSKGDENILLPVKEYAKVW